ncbi:hypothetical protein IEQ34_016281 [Dendrobium chrysotoxum]|uniref:ADP/ATP translocase n=1 Tax=Dendrobium chrysotoxum TaxID=161865 RepID=A0AAV7GEW2_DENCH|nr:hypothetical protein IEQ34_016281 [Dendrobium chrysotoxum]
MKKVGVVALWLASSYDLNFVFKDKMFNFKKDKDGSCKWCPATLPFSTMVDASSILIMYPLNYSKTHQTNDANAIKKIVSDLYASKYLEAYVSPYESKTPQYPIAQFQTLVYKKTIQSDGFVGLYHCCNMSSVAIMEYHGANHAGWALIQLTCKLLRGTTIVDGLSSHPIVIVHGRTTMTSREIAQYKSSSDVMRVPNSIFKGASTNILCVIAGASVLAGFHKLQVIGFGKKYGSSDGG